MCFYCHKNLHVTQQRNTVMVSIPTPSCAHGIKHPCLLSIQYSLSVRCNLLILRLLPSEFYNMLYSTTCLSQRDTWIKRGICSM